MPKIVFHIDEGHCEFLAMHFDLTNAPSIFPSLMNEVLKLSLRWLVHVLFDNISI